MNRHTPGPWMIYAEKNGSIRVDSSDKVIANANGATPECLSNAKLIAAAPEMYQTLRDIIDKGPGPTGLLRAHIEKILNKAEGK